MQQAEFPAERAQQMSEKNVSDGAALWHGRFEAAPADELMAYTESLSFDKRLWPDDIFGSQAHVKMLISVGLMSKVDGDIVLDALESVATEFADGSFVFEPSDEDIHTAIERRVTQIAGEPGGRIHTGRSRNDQVATAVRLWCKREVRTVRHHVLSLIDTLEKRAQEADAQTPAIRLPGYTHVQHAQPVLLSHHLRAHSWSLLRDAERLAQTLQRLDVSPLGAGALAGSSLPIDPEVSANEMGFATTFANSLDAVSDRDFIAEILFDIALLGVHLSRIGEEWVLWTSAEFGFATLNDAYATGSSMLPQKKNADIAELARGKAGRLIGNLTGLLAMLKGLPLAYNRDLQEDKEPLFDSVDQVRRALVALNGMIATATFNVANMTKGADAEALVATDLAEWLVQRGMPFREAHAVVGKVVRDAISSGTPMVDIVKSHPQLGADAAMLFAPGVALGNRRSPGAAGPDASAAQKVRLDAEISRAKKG
jgi:argininosuccinate lyase